MRVWCRCCFRVGLLLVVASQAAVAEPLVDSIRADINKDGRVDHDDLFIFQSQWHLGEEYTPTSTVPTLTPTPTPTSSSVTIAAVGDTNGYNILQTGLVQENPLGGIHALLDEDDIFVFNFEGFLVSERLPASLCPEWPGHSLYWSSARIADFLHPTRFTIATLANNHTSGCGNFGIQETLSEFSDRGILTGGAGQDSTQACEPIRLQVDGVDLAIVSYLAMDTDWFNAGSDRAGAATWDACSGQQQVARLAATEDIVIVALHLHLGPGWTDQPFPASLDLVQRILDAGADLVLAHGPHVPQGILVSQGRVALLSLGNFLFRPDYLMPERAHDSLMARITIFPDRLSVALIPLRLDDAGWPSAASTQKASEILIRLAELSAELGTTVDILGETGYLEVQRESRD